MRKLLGFLFGATMIASAAFGAVACEEESDLVNYEVNVKTRGGAPVSSIQVQAYQSDSLLQTKTTDASGKVVFELEQGTYDIKVVNLPQGYSDISGAEYQTSTSSTSLDYYLNTSIIKSDPPAGKKYKVGDIAYDFSVTTDDGSVCTLSEVLEEKKAVVLNFWATWCTYCIQEFPALQDAYNVYSEKLEVIALSTTDSMQEVQTWKGSNGYSFPMGADTIGLSSMYVENGIPLTAIIDRYGAVSYIHEGAADLETFLSLFAKYTAEDYAQDIVIGGNNDVPNDGVIEAVEPNVSMQDPATVASAINAPGCNVTYSARPSSSYTEEEYKYAWPWLVSNNELYPANEKLHYSFGIIFMSFHAEAGQTLAFDYNICTEDLFDQVFVQIYDGGSYQNTLLHVLDGNSNGYKTLYAFAAEREGNYTLSITYYRDTEDGKDAPTDPFVRLKNVRLVDVEEIDSPTQIKRYAAKGAYTENVGYASYITPVLNETDGYYHVGTADGPLLYADIIYSTPWSSASVYTYIYYDQCVFEGFDYGDLYSEYWWLCSNSNNEYVPVNEELRFLLELLVDNYGEGRENEWLELCLYYDRYLMSEESDPVKGLWFTSAIPVTVNVQDGVGSGSWTVNIEKRVLPRGYKYAFTPTTSGVYEVKSTGTQDTIGWLMDENRVQLAENDELLNPSAAQGKNFYFQYSFEAGKTYYVVVDLFSTNGETGVCGLDIIYVASEYDFFTNAATGPYTYEELTGEIYVPNAIKTVYDEVSDRWYELREDGTKGSKIYLDLTRGTPLLNTQSLEQILNESTAYEPEERAFYFHETLPDGTDVSRDYTDIMKQYLAQAKSGSIESELYGYVEVDAQLYDILKKFTAKYDGFGGLTDSWLMMCYYYQHLGA